ncbi:unnamed protein product [Meloidogyne enterolobii]|uniref:Uncharacterized protein n=1 Tax=Meloidogyne enterolobii TaxID=390850 RepID=A0ACB0XX50_MELEN
MCVQKISVGGGSLLARRKKNEKLVWTEKRIFERKTSFPGSSPHYLFSFLFFFRQLSGFSVPRWGRCGEVTLKKRGGNKQENGI